jgi:hypothetical protein
MRLVLLAMMSVAPFELEVPAHYSMSRDSARYVLREIEPAMGVDLFGVAAERITFRNGAVSVSFDGWRLAFD